MSIYILHFVIDCIKYIKLICFKSKYTINIHKRRVLYNDHGGNINETFQRQFFQDLR